MHINEKGNFRSVLLTASIIAIIILSSVLFAKHFDLRTYFFNLFFNDVYEVQKASKNLPISRESLESLEVAEIDELRQMLQDEQFDQLNSVLEEYQNIFEKNQTDEYKVYDAYRTFDFTVASFEDLFKKWIDTSPDKYQPYLAIAQFYYAKGWESRGYKWKKDTSEKQFEEMGLFFEKAEDNLNIALEINPNLMIAYNTLIGIYNANGNDESEDRIIAKTFELFPHSFLIKSTISWAKEPRWGGSYKQMENLAKNFEKFSDKNPKIPVLYGFIYYDQARNFKRNKKHEKALELFNKALNFGDHWSFYNERAKIYHYDLKSYDQALEDAHRSIELRSPLHENYLMRSRIYYAKMDYAESINDLQTAEMIKPGNPEVQRWKKWASDNMMKRGHQVFKSDLREAVKYYNISLEFDDNNFQTYYWRGRAFVGLKDFESALSDFQIAIEINPQHFESYSMIDYIYSQEQQWDNIINYWDKFIELEPDHAGAYFERSGSHYHNKDMESAISDLKKACELGNKKACKKYNMLKK